METIMETALDKELIQYFTRLNDPQKKSLLEMIKSFLKPGNESLDFVGREQYNRELDEAMKRIDAGSFTTLEVLEKEIQTW